MSFYLRYSFLDQLSLSDVVCVPATSDRNELGRFGPFLHICLKLERRHPQNVSHTTTTSRVSFYSMHRLTQQRVLGAMGICIGDRTLASVR